MHQLSIDFLNYVNHTLENLCSNQNRIYQKFYTSVVKKKLKLVCFKYHSYNSILRILAMEKIEVPSYLKFTNRDIKELLVKNVGVFRCFPQQIWLLWTPSYHCSLFSLQYRYVSWTVFYLWNT